MGSQVITHDFFQQAIIQAQSAAMQVCYLSLVVRKPVFGVSDQVRHKLGCTTTEDGYRLEFWTQKVEGLYYPCSGNKGADQPRVYR